MKNKIISIIQIVMTLVLMGALKIWAPVCQGVLDLANGNQTHMKCWFSSQAVFAVALVVLAMTVVSLFMDKKPRKKLQIAVIVACVVMILIFTNFIGICAKTTMACHTTDVWVKVLSAVIAVLGLVDMFTGKENQIPE